MTTTNSDTSATFIDAFAGGSPLRVCAHAVSHTHLLRNLVARDLQLKYRGSLLGVVWSLLNPLSLLAVYTLAFKYIVGNTNPRFVLLLFVGLSAWSYFAAVVSASTSCIVDNTGLLRVMNVPRAILPLAVTIFHLVQHLLLLVIVLTAGFTVAGHQLLLSLWCLPALVLLLSVFAWGWALALSALCVSYRDVRHLVEVSLPMLFWASPIVYDIARVPDAIRTLIVWSPATPFVLGYQALLVHGQVPSGGAWLAMTAYALLAAYGGLMLFARLDRSMVEVL
jgi:ABC-type polysaccharide/polyol phosphate export permease